MSETNYLIKQYQVITDYHLKDFSSVIEELLSKGWELYGSLATSLDRDGDIVYSQAMIKQE